MKRIFLVLVLVASLAFAATCVDEDDGVNYLVKALCRDPYKERTDYCLSETKVAEFYCSNNYTGYCWATSYNCMSVEGSAGECLDGACVMIEESVEAAQSSPTPEPVKTPGYDIGALPEKEGVYSNEEAPKPIEHFPFWLVLSGIAILLLIAYRSSQERIAQKPRKKGSGRK